MKAPDARSRISLRNILYATDFSPAAWAALPYALGIARRYDCKLFSVHVRPPDSYTFAARPVSAPIDQEMARAVESLDQWLKDLRHEILIREGETWPQISKIIGEKEIDLLVIGTHGRTGLERVLLGSVAEAIFRQAPCPVLTVGPHAPKDADRLADIHEILYATDFTPEASAAAPYAISLAQEHQARLTLLHVIDDSKTAELAHPERIVSTSLQVLRDLVPPEAELWCKPEVLVERGVPAEKILEVAEQRRADLIVLGVRRADRRIGVATHLAHPIAHEIVTRASCPVLTVRA